jgi:hypothetical protein
MRVSGVPRSLLVTSLLWVHAAPAPWAQEPAGPAATGAGAAPQPGPRTPGPEPAGEAPRPPAKDAKEAAPEGAQPQAAGGQAAPPEAGPAGPPAETPARPAEAPSPPAAKAEGAAGAEAAPSPAGETQPATQAGDPAAVPPEGQVGKLAAGKIELGGALEMEANWARVCRVPSAGRPCATTVERGLALTAAEFDFEAKLVSWAKAELAAEWARDSPSGTSAFDLNEAFITLGEGLPVTLKAGVGKVPFGLSTGSTIASKLEDTLTMTDPLTIQVFDAKEEYASLQGTYRGFHATLFVFEGSTRGPGRTREHYGGNIGYSSKGGRGEVTVGLSAIESVFDADELSGAYPEALNAGWTPALAAHARVAVGRFQVGGAYYGALGRGVFLRRLPGSSTTTMRVQPEAWHVEAGYTREILGRRTVMALSFSQSYGVGACPQALPGGTTCTALSQYFPQTFPRWRAIANASRWLRENMRIAVEFVRDEDYPPSKRGNGTSTASNVLAQLLYEW